MEREQHGGKYKIKNNSYMWGGGNSPGLYRKGYTLHGYNFSSFNYAMFLAQNTSEIKLYNI